MKLLKRWLVLITALSLFIPTFAFSDGLATSGAEMLRKYDFIKGVNGDLLLAKSLTRGEVAVLMADMRGKKREAEAFSKKTGFTDVSEKEWYASYVAYGKASGYLGGYPDGSFKPGAAVSAQEFAAFLMNALGYNGDYEYAKVIDFAKTKKVNVSVKGYAFVRGDAFEAMWAAVNQPLKGVDVPLGVTLGRFSASTPVVPTEPTVPTLPTVSVPALEYSLKALSSKSIEVTFTTPVDKTEGIQFNLTQLPKNIAARVNWNDSKTVAVLTVDYVLPEGFYELTVSDLRVSPTKVYDRVSFKMEKEKVAKVVFEKETLTRVDDYFGTVKFTVYNQYNEVITNTNLGRQVQFLSSTSVPSPIVDYSTGIVTIQHGSTGQTAIRLVDLPNVSLMMSAPDSAFASSQILKINSLSNGLSEVRISGIVDEDGKPVDFVYGSGKVYYLDAYAVDNDGNIVRSNAILGAVSSGRENMIVNVSSAVQIKVVKVPHPTRPNEIALRISFVDVPTTDQPVMFTVIVPSALDKSAATFVTTLRMK